MAGSRVISRSSSGKRPSACRRIVRFWASIIGVSWSVVAKWSCQNRVSFSCSGRGERTMRSSHHSTSWPDSLNGFSGWPSTVGAAMRGTGATPPFSSQRTVADLPRRAQ